MSTIIRDLGAYDATWTRDHGGTVTTGIDDLADTDTSAEVVLTTNIDDVIVGHFGVGSDTINWPTDIPAGYTLTDLRYVVIAYSETGGTIGVDTSTWGYTPSPETWPFITLQSSFRFGTFAVDHLPVGGYAGETVARFSDLATFSSDESLDTIQMDTWTTFSPIHIAYFAIRLTYTTADDVLPVGYVPRRASAPLRVYPRSDGRGASSARRIWPPTPSRQASNRIVGGYL